MGSRLRGNDGIVAFETSAPQGRRCITTLIHAITAVDLKLQFMRIARFNS
jgi:hypothetical protein